MVVLPACGTKTWQQRDIATAHTRWTDYKKRRAPGTMIWH
jgi:hypothetical protein